MAIPLWSTTARASMISVSLTCSTSPLVAFSSRTAFLKLTGLPICIALATVVCASTGSSGAKPFTKLRYSGFARSDCAPTNRGSRSIRSSSFSSRSPLPSAEIFPAFPTGTTK